MTATDPCAVLVYGTLRPGEHNHGLVAYLVAEATDVTVPGWALRGGWGFPYATPEPDHRLVATHLRFHPEDWAEARGRMDSLEGYPWHYDRTVVTGWYPEPPSERWPHPAALRGWLYVPTALAEVREQHPIVPGGDWCSRPSRKSNR